MAFGNDNDNVKDMTMTMSMTVLIKAPRFLVWLPPFLFCPMFVPRRFHFLVPRSCIPSMISVLPLHERRCKIFHIYTVDQNSTLIEFNKKN